MVANPYLKIVFLTGILPPNGQLVLAGDPQQLGPVVRSPIAIKSGLQKSLLERLMAREVYHPGEWTLVVINIS